MRSAVPSAWILGVLMAATFAGAAEWSNWRGPARNGTSPETGLVSRWSLAGDNLVWRVDFVGRSTPVVFDGRVCASGRTGADNRRQEMVACFDAGNGDKLWERRWNVYNTSVPWTRVGWANVAGDPETGYLYVQGVGGLFFCLDSRNGDVVWSRSLIEELGFMEGYGGRTQTPLVDEDRVIVSFSNTSWGSEARPLHRYRAFDKRTGELLWVSQPAPSQADKNTQSTPNVMVVDGRRLIVAGNGGGGIYAVEAYTGESVWGFQLSKRGINTSVVVDKTTVYASHSEENMDGGPMGRVVAIDGRGTGDVTATHEIWRRSIGAGFSSPALAGGVLYVVDNSANLHALDAATGETRWELNVGRVGKGSPVVADGKLYVTEVNGRLVIVGLGRDEGTILDIEEIPVAGENRMAEVYSSPAVAYGRVYFATEEGLYCLGDKSRPLPQAAGGPPTAPVRPARGSGEVARIRVMPAEVAIAPGDTVDFRVEAFDANGNPLGELAASWTLQGLDGKIDADGGFSAETGQFSQSGLVVAKAGDHEAGGRVRILQGLPIREDFESVAPGSRPGYQMAYLARFQVEEQDGNKVLAKGPSPIKIHRHITFLGKKELSDYTIAADLKGTRSGRKLPDVGLINGGYTMELLGGHQKIQVRSWQAGLRMAQEIPFPWQPDVWYRMKLRVERTEGKGLIRGKVWPKDEPEPEDWTVVVEDPLPIPEGAPGLSGYSPTPIYFDNVEVTSNR